MHLCSSVCGVVSVIISNPQLHIRPESAWRGEGLQASVYCKEISYNQQPRVFITKKVIVSFLWLFWLFWHSEMFTKGQAHSSGVGGGNVWILSQQPPGRERHYQWRVASFQLCDLIMRAGKGCFYERILSWSFSTSVRVLSERTLVQQLSARLMRCWSTRLLCGCWGKSEIISCVILPWGQTAREGCSVKSSSLFLNSACVCVCECVGAGCFSLSCYWVLSAQRKFFVSTPTTCELRLLFCRFLHTCTFLLTLKIDVELKPQNVHSPENKTQPISWTIQFNQSSFFSTNNNNILRTPTTWSVRERALCTWLWLTVE